MNGGRTSSAARCLIVVAAPVEATAVLRGVGRAADTLTRWTPVPIGPNADLVECGIGKVNAGACVARLLDGGYRAVLSVGLCGALPGSDLRPGMTVLASTSVYADEGIVTPGGFLDCGEMGFPMGPFSGRQVPLDHALIGRLTPLVDRVGPIATVSTCSGTNAGALEVCARTGALAEAMEGAAVAHVACTLGVACGEVRVVSNTTGDRPLQHWDVPCAVESLGYVLARALKLL